MIIATILNVTSRNELPLLLNSICLNANDFKKTMKKIFKGSQKTWNKFPKPALNIGSPYIEWLFLLEQRILKLVKLRVIF